MSVQSCLIKDDSGNDYVVKDIKSFRKHLFEFHASGTSLHEENGYYFLVNKKFRDLLYKLKE